VSLCEVCTCVNLLLILMRMFRRIGGEKSSPFVHSPVISPIQYAISPIQYAISPIELFNGTLKEPVFRIGELNPGLSVRSATS
jgi:hypothetical protein